ncbi:hypothetical protein BH18ACT5_BH18ACT5_12770 [soil metagenome]
MRGRLEGLTDADINGPWENGVAAVDPFGLVADADGDDGVR